MVILLCRRMQDGYSPNIIFSPRLQRISPEFLSPIGYAVHMELCRQGQTQGKECLLRGGQEAGETP